MKYRNNLKQLKYFLILLTFSNVRADDKQIKSGIIFQGFSTIERGPKGFGMDYYLQRPCTSATDNCIPHIQLDWYHDKVVYDLIIVGTNGLYKDVGKLNLDSIKSAPSDTGMTPDGKPGVSPVFSIAPDSLTKCIGNVYIIKTGRDPRRTVPMYAKIKILSFTVRDSAKHEVDMGFLWACNISGSRDLVTTGLDTFNLETPTILSYDKGSTRLRPAVFVRPGKYSTFLMLHGMHAARGVKASGVMVGVGGVGLDGRTSRALYKIAEE